MLAAGCGPEGPTNVPVPSASTAASSEPPPPPGGVFRSKRFGAVLHLTDGDAWHIDDTRTKWLVAAEPTTSSSLLRRTWRDENRMTREKCEDRARSIRKLPSRESATIIQHDTLSQPEGFDTTFDVGLVPDPAHDGIYGFILSFGGYAHKCFAFVYVTKDQGKDADSRVAERLAGMVEGTLKKLRFETELAPEIEHAPEPPTE